MAEKESKVGIIVLVILGLAAAFGGVYSIISMMNPSDSNNEKEGSQSATSTYIESQVEDLEDEYIAVISIKGVIEEKNETYDQEWLINTIEVLREDEENKALLLAINSPGGGLYEADEVYYALQKYKQTGRPVWAYLGQTAASGGYYIACAADRIFTHKTTLTGSIGVLLGPSIDISELLEKYGVKTTTFTSGKNKNMLSFDNPVTEEQREIMQSIVDDAYEQFVEVVVDGRDLSEQTVRTLADGRIYTARQALAHDLVDTIAYFDETLASLQAELIAFLSEETSDPADLEASESTESNESAEYDEEYDVQYFEPRNNRDSLYELLEDFSFLMKTPNAQATPIEILEKLVNEAGITEYTLML